MAGGPRRLQRGERLVLATHNAGKLREIAALLAPYGVAATSAGALGLPEPEEDAPDFAGNARLKALAAAMASGEPSLADDSGFGLAALGGDPGVLSARWAGPGKDFATAMARVEARLGGSADRRAWFSCALCLAWPDGASATFLGRVEGEACWPPRGSLGFGYDPMFVPAGGVLSYGEMPAAEKHAGSHRARAFAQLAAACLPQGRPGALPLDPAKGQALWNPILRAFSGWLDRGSVEHGSVRGPVCNLMPPSVDSACPTRKCSK